MFKEVAVELRNITHSYESDLSIQALLSKKPIIRDQEYDQPRISIFHNHSNSFSLNGTVDNYQPNLNGNANGTVNGGLNLNSNNLNSNLNGNLNGNLNHSDHKQRNRTSEDVQMILLNQSKQFPSFYFRQNENNNYENYNRNHSYKRSRTFSQTSFAKKLFPESSSSKRYVLNQLDMTIPKASIYGLLGECFNILLLLFKKIKFLINL